MGILGRTGINCLSLTSVNRSRLFRIYEGLSIRGIAVVSVVIPFELSRLSRRKL